jgi:glycerol-3-phosphate acyltransferase PlsY
MAPKVLLLFSFYLLGSIPFGVLFAKMKGVDPRKGGSGNIGATNVMRTAGKTMGLLTLISDLLKGGIPAFVGKSLYGPEWGFLFGLCAFFGHLFPAFLKFKGGKGVATATGLYLVLTPLPLALSLGVFAIVLLLTRRVSLGSISGALSMPCFLYLNLGTKTLFYFSLLLSSFIIIRHFSNVKRLIAGQEPRIF